MQAAVIFTAGDQDLHLLGQPPQAVEVVAVQRLLEPEYAQPLQLARRLQRALVTPDRSFFRLRCARLLRLVGIDEQHELVAHRLAHLLNLGDVGGHRPVVQAKFHCPPALGPPRRGVRGTLRARP